MREATLAASLLIDFIGHLERRGIDAARVHRAAQLDPAALYTPDARVPAAAMERLWVAGEALTGDADIGLHAAEAYNPGALGIVGYVILSCRHAGEALERLARYAPLLNEGLQVRLVHAPGLTRCEFGANPRRDSFLQRTPRQAIETLAAGIVLTLARLSNGATRPLAVHLRHAAPADAREHRRLLGPELRFEQADNAVIYRAEALAASLLSADPALLAVFDGDAAARLARLAQQDEPLGTTEALRALLATRLKGVVPPLAELAQLLGTSERSLQRRLRDEGSSYRELVDAVRRTLAPRWLAQPGVSATEVAFLLGYSELSAYTRARRRWAAAGTVTASAAEPGAKLAATSGQNAGADHPSRDEDPA